MKTYSPQAKLAGSLRRRWDGPKMLVLADWCEDHSLVGAAATLRKSGEAPTRRAQECVSALAEMLGCRRIEMPRAWWEWTGRPPPAPNFLRHPLHFMSQEVPSLARVAIRASPPVLFRADRLLISSSTARSFVVHALRVGGMNALAQSAPAELFTELAIPVHIGLTAKGGEAFELEVENRSTSQAPMMFQAMLLGTISAPGSP